MESKTANDLEVTESKSSVEDYIALETSGDVIAFSPLCGLCLPSSIHPCLFVDFCISPVRPLGHTCGLTEI